MYHYKLMVEVPPESITAIKYFGDYIYFATTDGIVSIKHTQKDEEL